MNSQRLLAALCFALLCSGLLTWQLSRHVARPIAEVKVRGVVVAARDLAAGEALTSTSLKIVNLPVSLSTVTGLVARTEELDGRVLLIPVSSGEPITVHELAEFNTPAGLAATIPTGMRAFPVPASDLTTGNNDLITPGNRIDVLVSYHSDAAAAFVSSMVLEDVPVVGDARKFSEGSEKPVSAEIINLLVTPEQAARLTVARSLGKLTFALRNGTDKGLSQGLAQVALTPLLVEKGSPLTPARVQRTAVASPEQRPYTVEMLSGGKSFTRSFAESQP